jgi:glycosyltransferase involved in cell wall biosynthesis
MCIIVIAIVGVLPLTWYRPTYSILKGDNSPFWFSASQTFFDDMSMWWDADMLGHMSGLPTLVAYSFPWYILQSLGFSNGLIQLVLLSILFFSSGLTMFYFLSILIGNKPIPLLIGSLFYMTNVSVVISVTYINIGMIWMRAFLPLILALFVKLIRKRTHGESTRKLLLCFLLVFSFATSFLTVNAAILAISLLCLGVMALYVALAEKSYVRVAFESTKIAVLLILTNLWWIIPFGLLSMTTAGGSAQNLNVWEWSWTHTRGSILNVLWFNADWGGLPEYFPFIDFYSNPFVILTTFLPITVAAFGLLFKRRDRLMQYLFFGVVLVATFFTKGLHPPFEQVNVFLYENLPYFAMLFREPMSKFTFMITLFAAPLVACGIDSIITTVKAHSPLKRKMFSKVISFSLLTLLILIFVIPSAPMFLGGTMETKTEQLPFPSYVQIPSYWFELSNYFSGDADDFRVLVLPDNDFYQMPYVWGYYGSDALPLRFVSKPVVYNTYGYQQQVGTEMLDAAYQALKKGDKLAFDNLLTVMNVKYILLRNDIMWNFTESRNIADPELVGSLLNNNTDIEFVQSIGDLDIFKRKNWKPSHFYTPTRILKVETSFLFDLLSPYVNFNNDILLLSEELKNVQNMPWQISSCSIYAIGLNDLNHTGNTFFKNITISTSGMYVVNLISNLSIPINVDKNSLSLSESHGSFATSPIYLEQGVHRIEMVLQEEQVVPVESWKNVSVENQFSANYSIEVEQDILKATLYDSNFGWKTLNSPVVEVSKDEKYIFSFEVAGENVHQLHAKVLEYTKNFTLLGAIYGNFLLEGTFDYTPLNVTYSPLYPETQYAQLMLWHGHETDQPLPNILWLRNSRLAIDRTASFSGLILSNEQFFSEETEAEKLALELTYVKLSPYEYRVHIENSEPFFLFFSESYDPLWKVVEGDAKWYNVPFGGDLSSYHISGHKFGNVWYINKTGSFDVTIFYTPQSYLYYASIVSGITFGILIIEEVVRYLNKKRGFNFKKKWVSNVSIIVFGSSAPLSGFFIRTRQIIRALSMLGQSVTVINLGNNGFRKILGVSEFDNIRGCSINCISQTHSKGSVYSPLRQLAFQAESLKIMQVSRILRNSPVVLFISCLQIIPMIVSKVMGAMIILDINDVNSRTALRAPDIATRTIRFLLWQPLERAGCTLADIVIVNKEEEGEFLTKYMHVHPSKIFVLKTCLEENQNIPNTQLASELDKFNIKNKRVVLFTANMTAFMNKRSAQYIISELAPSFSKFSEFNDVVFVLAGVGSDGLMPLTSNVMTTGTLNNASLAALVNYADVCIDPAIISGGIKTKIQYYLQCGKIVITTPFGAEGINLYGRKDIAFLNSRLEDFEKALKYALANLERLKKLAENNRDVYEKQFSWKTFVKQVQTLVQRIAQTN